ncbi:MAG: cyclic nucleotide-binding domain-containing protein [Comamonadaceae bacterium]|nr:MAG: cyclic nucleotide-binding domain-containing protein [Comamonadaceae bacterium]
MTTDHSFRGAAPDLREEAALMLMRSSFVAELDLHEARIVVDAMRPLFVETGTVIMKEGQSEDVDYMALLLEGQVRAESASNMPGEEVVISIIGPGQLMGEMGILDGEPRSATCTALTDLKLAILSRAALRGLVEVQPAVASRLLLAIAQSMADRVRESNRRFRTLSRVTRALQRELDATHAVNRRLLDGQDGAAARR